MCPECFKAVTVEIAKLQVAKGDVVVLSGSVSLPRETLQDLGDAVKFILPEGVHVLMMPGDADIQVITPITAL